MYLTHWHLISEHGGNRHTALKARTQQVRFSLNSSQCDFLHKVLSESHSVSVSQNTQCLFSVVCFCKVWLLFLTSLYSWSHNVLCCDWARTQGLLLIGQLTFLRNDVHQPSQCVTPPEHQMHHCTKCTSVPIHHCTECINAPVHCCTKCSSAPNAPMN